MIKIRAKHNKYELNFKNDLTVFVAFLLLGASAHAALDFGFAKEDAGQPGAFLEFANSARTLAMAGAGTAVSEDASAVISNPAGLAQVQRKNLVMSYSTLFEDTKFSVINYAHPHIDMGTFGLGVVNLHSGSFDRRDVNGTRDGSFGISETALLLSHGIEMGNRFSLGSSLKVIRQQVDEFSATGYGFDGAAMMKINPKLNLGLTLRNILAPKIKLRNQTDTYPLDLRLGARWQMAAKWMLAADINQTADRTAKIRLGTEWALSPLLVLRAGINETEMTTGLGFVFKDWGLDYSFGYNDAAAGVKDLGSSHRLGFHLDFGKKINEVAASVRWQKQGQDNLAKLREKMDGPNTVRDMGLDKLIASTRQVIRRQGYLKAEDLYEAQGYVSYFEGQFERSVQALGEALVLKPQDETLARHLESVRAQLTAERTEEIVTSELKRLKDTYEKGDWKAALKSCEKILSFRPDNIEATTYMEDVRNRINEPIEREMKIAVAKFERADYLDAIKSFQRVKEMSPDHQEASDYIAKSIEALERLAATAAETSISDPSRPVVNIERNTEQSRMLYSKGLLFYSQGNLQEAVRLWEQAVSSDTHNALARNAYNRAQMELREKKR
ncbi:MAG: hypothetical protein KCHDKBKB_01199 [Elusimicrobia bacterium]|nr:hypothetical protein [Elusimicrobiota bacterium]